jgi:hypothetical protein
MKIVHCVEKSQENVFHELDTHQMLLEYDYQNQ